MMMEYGFNNHFRLDGLLLFCILTLVILDLSMKYYSLLKKEKGYALIISAFAIAEWS